MKARSYGYDSSGSDSENTHDKGQTSSSSKPKVPTYYKKLFQGDTGGLIGPGTEKSRAIKQEMEAINTTISEAQNIEGIRDLLDKNNKEITIKKNP